MCSHDKITQIQLSPVTEEQYWTIIQRSTCPAWLFEISVIWEVGAVWCTHPRSSCPPGPQVSDLLVSSNSLGILWVVERLGDCYFVWKRLLETGSFIPIKAPLLFRANLGLKRAPENSSHSEIQNRENGPEMPYHYSTPWHAQRPRFYKKWGRKRSENILTVFLNSWNTFTACRVFLTTCLKSDVPVLAMLPRYTLATSFGNRLDRRSLKAALA